MKDYVTTDPDSTPWLLRLSLMGRFRVSGMVSIHYVIQKGGVGVRVGGDG